MSEVFANVMVTLVHQTCWCGTRHAVPDTLVNKQKRQLADGLRQTAIFCPLGHEYISAGASKVTELEQQLHRERQRLDQAQAEVRESFHRNKRTEKKLQVQKGLVTRIKNRVKNGVCPCCNRSFVNLHQHMSKQHPEFGNENRTTESEAAT